MAAGDQGPLPGETRARRRARILAALGSFAVYLTPIYTVHYTAVLGVSLAVGLFRGSDRGAGWIAADLGLAAILQGLAFVLIYWCARHWRLWRGLIVLTMVPVFFIAANAGYLVAIPTLFLVEGERAGARGTWPVACEIDDAEVASLPADPLGALEAAGETWIVQDGKSLGRITAQACAAGAVPVIPFRTSLIQVVPGGGAIFQSYPQGGGRPNLSVVAPGGVPRRVEGPPGERYWRPVLSSDGARLAWVQRRRTGSGMGTAWSVHVRNLADGAETTVMLQMDRPAAIEPIAWGKDGRLLARRNTRALIWIDPASGAILPVAEAPDPATQPVQGVVVLDTGWVGWDIYRDKGRHRVAWALGAARGTHEVPSGRGIHHVSVSPDGALIAISVGPNLRIGSVKDAVYVLRASDGVELYRRFFPPYTRSRPAFLGTGHLALTVVDGSRPRVEVLTLPAAAP